MKKYIIPKLEISEFGRENVMTLSALGDSNKVRADSLESFKTTNSGKLAELSYEDIKFEF